MIYWAAGKGTPDGTARAWSCRRVTPRALIAPSSASPAASVSAGQNPASKLADVPRWPLAAKTAVVAEIAKGAAEALQGVARPRSLAQVRSRNRTQGGGRRRREGHGGADACHQ